VGGVYVEAYTGLSSDLVWLEERQTFGWWWAGDEKPHAFRVSRVEEDDFQTVLYHEGGKLAVFGLWYDDQAAELAQWDQRKPAEQIGAALTQYAEVVSLDSVSPVIQTARRQYEVMIEVRRASETDTWVVIGAWAADADEIEFYALPRYAGQAEYWQRQIRSARATGGQPLEILAYWYEGANVHTTQRIKRDPVLAESALGAALKAATEAAAELATGG
jgi:hypothetical protein